jgi:hypothetical protein
MKHLQYTSKPSETLETYTCKALSSATFTCCWDEWSLVDAKLDTRSELDATESRGGTPVGGQLGAAPMSDSAAPKNGCATLDDRTSRHGPRGEAPPRCTGEGEAAGVRPRELVANAPSSSLAGKERWREREVAAARSRGEGGIGVGVGRRVRSRRARAAALK